MGKLGTLHLNIYLSLLHFNFNIISFFTAMGNYQTGIQM